MFDADNTKCAICDCWGDGDDPKETDPLLSCACGMWVHAHCYGPQYMLPPKLRKTWPSHPADVAASLSALARARPAPAFKCAVCVADLPPGLQRPCRVCLRNVAGRSDASLRAAKPLADVDAAANRGAKQPPPPPLPGRASAWVHISCALWCPGAAFLDYDGREQPLLEGGAAVGGGGGRSGGSSGGAARATASAAAAAAAAPADARCLLCEAAGRPALGVTLKCHAPGCSLSFHMLCGREQGWELVSLENARGGVDMHAFCGPHSSAAHMQAVGDGDGAVVCEVCGKDDKPAELLLCDGCDMGWHMRCATPQLKEVPEGEWFCAGCSSAGRGSRGGGGSGSGAAAARGSAAGASSSSSGGGGGGGGSAASATAAGAGAKKRPRGVDAEVPNTYFTHHRLLTRKDPPPLPPSLGALLEVDAEAAAGGAADPVQMAWAAAGARADRSALLGWLLPMLRGGGAGAVTVSSVGDPLPASWNLALSFAEAEGGDARVMLVDMAQKLLLGSLEGGASLNGGALVVYGFGEATQADWHALPRAKLLVLVASDPHELLAVPPEVLAGRMVVRFPPLLRFFCQRSRALLPFSSAASPPPHTHTHTHTHTHPLASCTGAWKACSSHPSKRRRHCYCKSGLARRRGRTGCLPCCAASPTTTGASLAFCCSTAVTAMSRWAAKGCSSCVQRGWCATGCKT